MFLPPGAFSPVPLIDAPGGTMGPVVDDTAVIGSIVWPAVVGLRLSFRDFL